MVAETKNQVLWSEPVFDHTSRQSAHWWVKHPEQGWRVWRWQPGPGPDSPWEWCCGIISLPHSVVNEAGWQVMNLAAYEETGEFW